MSGSPAAAGQRRAVVTLAALCVALSVCLAWVLLRPRPLPPATDLPRPLTSAEGVAGVLDTFPDPEVGRVLQPGLAGRDFHGARVATNSVGLREREYAAAKPDGLVRVVLLGDSHLFGWGLPTERRVGDQLELALDERRTADVPVEVLTLAVPSWNAAAACAFLRRQLDVLRPDLVVQTLTPNDLDDGVDVRGFGVLSTSGSQHRERADALVYENFPIVAYGASQHGLLSYGLDFESRQRYSDARRELAELADDVAALGGSWRGLVLFGARIPLARRLFDADREDELAIWLAAEFMGSPEYRLSPQDGHFSEEGHRQIARLLYGVIRDGDLLPALELAPWPEAARAVERWHETGRVQARRTKTLGKLIASRRIATTVVFTDLDDDTATQVHGGVDRRGRVGPYASILLRNASAETLRIRGRCFDRPQLDGAAVRVFVEDRRVHTLALAPGAPIDLSLEVPPEVRDRSHLSVRFVSDDWVYAPEDVRHCVVFELQSVSLE